MAYKTTTILLFIIFVSLGSAENVIQNIWPSGNYCILMGSAGECPIGFVKQAIRLSVPQNFMPSDKFRDGENIINIGNVGSSRLRALSYEDVYVMDIKTCCKE